MEKTNFAKTKRCMAVLLALVLMCTMLSNALITAMATTTDIDALLATVDADAVTIADAATINEIGALYDALDTDTQATYTDTVAALRSALATEVKKGYTAISTSNFQTGYYHWQKSVGHAVTNDVLRLTFSRSSNTNPAVNAEMTSTYKFDGFEVMFNNFVINSDTAAYAGINMLFAKSANVDFSKSTVSGLLLSLDVKNGKLIVNFKDYTSGTLTYKYAEIAESDLLKADSLQYNAFAIAVNATADANNPYAVTVTLADGNSVTGNIPADCFNADAVLSSEKAVVQFTVGALNSTGAIMSGATDNSYDVVGYRDNTVAVSNIAWLNEKIAALDVEAVKESDIAAINEIEAVYNSLIDMNKAQVVNAEKIATLKQAVLPLVKEGYITYGAASEFTSDHWSSSAAPVLSYADGMIGLCFNDTALSVGKRIGPDNAVEFDGIEYKFNNLVSHSTTTTVAGFGIAFTKDTSFVSSGTFSSGLLLFLDAKAGNLLLNLNGKTKYLTLIENSDVLKLANLQYNAFTLGIAATNDENNPYCVTVRSANGQSVSANIPAEYFDAATVMSDGKSYVTFTRGRYDSTGATTGSTYTTFNVVGYRNSKDSQANIAWVNEQLAALDASTVTTSDVATINKIDVLYGAMIPAEKASIVGAEEIAALTAKAGELVADGYTVLKTSNLTGYHYHNTFTHSTVDGLVRMNFTVSNMNPARTTWINYTVRLDGLKVKVNRFYANDSATKTGLGVVLSAGSNLDGIDITQASRSGFILYIDMNTGDLIAQRKDGSTVTTTKIVEGNDLLKYANLQYEAIEIGFDVEDDVLNVSVSTADGDTVSATVPADYFNAETVLADGKTYFALTPGRYNPTGASGFETAAINDTFDIIGYCEAEEKAFAGASISVGSNIDVNFKVNPDVVADFTDVYAKFTVGSQSVDVTETTTDDNGRLVYSLPQIAPNLMVETIYATIYGTDAEGNPVAIDEAEYTIAEYCYNMLEKNAGNAKLCQVLIDTLKYGASAQTYTGRDTDNLATYGLTEDQLNNTATPTLESCTNTKVNAEDVVDEQVKWKSASLYLDGQVNLRFKIQTASLAGTTFKVVTENGEWTLTTDDIARSLGNNTYYLDFGKLGAHQMRDKIEITAYKDGVAVSNTLRYSVESYAYAKQNSTTPGLANLVKSIINYGDSTAAYLAQ